MEPRRALALSLCLLAAAGCRSKEDIPYLGRWEGEFTVKKVVGKTQVTAANRNGWKGYILLYRTQDGELGNRCQSHLENEQEGVDLKGHWRVRRNQIEIAFNEVKINDAGGLDERDPNKAYLDSGEIHREFALPLILTAEKKTTVLQGALTNFGPLEGSYRFVKSGSAH